jgi:hypothetical protein
MTRPRLVVLEVRFVDVKGRSIPQQVKQRMTSPIGAVTTDGVTSSPVSADSQEYSAPR